MTMLTFMSDDRQKLKDAISEEIKKVPDGDWLRSLIIKEGDMFYGRLDVSHHPLEAIQGIHEGLLEGYKVPFIKVNPPLDTP